MKMSGVDSAFHVLESAGNPVFLLPGSPSATSAVGRNPPLQTRSTQHKRATGTAINAPTIWRAFGGR